MVEFERVLLSAERQVHNTVECGSSHDHTRAAHTALRNAQYTWYYFGGLCTTVVVKHECARPGR